MNAEAADGGVDEALRRGRKLAEGTPENSVRIDVQIAHGTDLRREHYLAVLDDEQQVKDMLAAIEKVVLEAATG